MKTTFRFFAIVLAFATVALGIWWAISTNMKASLDEQQAYDRMYAQVAFKSPDHRNLVSFYQSCLANARPQRFAVDRGAPRCMEETSAWSQKLTLRVPFYIIREDILLAEANAYLELQER